MLSVIIDARRDMQRLPGLLAQLTAGAVEGLVREVLILAAADEPLVGQLCDETGAERYAPSAGLRGDRVLVVPARMRLRDGWIEALERGLADGGEAVVVGLREGGLFARAPRGALVERRRFEGCQGPDLEGLLRGLGLRARRIG